MTDLPMLGDKRFPALGGKRVLLLFPHLVTPGGAIQYTLKLGESLQREGAEVGLLTLRMNQGACNLPTGVKVISLGGPLTSSMAYWLLFPFWQDRMNRAIAAWQPDVIVPQVFPANWWGWLYKRKHPGTKLAWVCHEPSAFIHSIAWIRALRPWWKSLLARGLRPFLAAMDVSLVRYCDRVIANSRFTESALERVYGIAPDGIAYPGIDFPASPVEKRQKERSIITVARLTKFKRVDFLLDVFGGVLKVHPDLTYHIVGTGEDEAFLRGLAKRLGLGSRVVFHGAVDGPILAGLYMRASLLLHGAVDEPFGMAALEAIAYGTPVMAHNSGGLTEFVSEDCGRLIASMSVEDWAKEIVAYLGFLFAHEDFPERVRQCARSFEWRLSLQPAVEVIAGLCAEIGGSPLNDSGKKIVVDS
jgi:glycosyltransferase involved in cell wall biosynthesis